MNINLPEHVRFIIDTLDRNGYDAYAVGGCVRDAMLGRFPNDWDVTTNALPDITLSLFSHTIPTGIKHGTITVLIDKEPYEITTYRIDGEYSDNRHPDNVKFTNSLEEDLSRRDFTINAMAYNVKSGLLDPFNGLEDLKNHVVECVGNPHNRFNEDALRMMRAVRFANQLNFNIDKNTLASIKTNSHLIKNVSIERIREEFTKILLCDRPSSGLLLLRDTGLLKYILPEITKTIDFDQRNPHHNKDVFLHTLSVIDNSPKNLVVRLGALLHDIGKPDSFSIDEKGIGHFYGHEVVGTELSEVMLRRMKFDNDTTNKVLILVKEHMSRFSNLRQASLKKLMTRVGLQNLESLFQLQTADIKASAPPFDLEPVEYLRRAAEKILKEKQPLSVKDLAITGSDLIQMGFKPGKRIGEILNSLLELVLENPDINNKDDLQSYVPKE